jgi:hypothetical protein
MWLSTANDAPLLVRVFTFQMLNIQIRVHTLYLRPLSVWVQYSNL